MKVGNSNLGKAKVNKNDEFYTSYKTIEEEVLKYKHKFKNKVVYCNCDDATESNFSKFFVDNFESLRLKRLVVSGYRLNGKENAVVLDYSGSMVVGRTPSINELELKTLKGNGDFRSEESKRILSDVDIVVTNPPFSLFREFIAQMIYYNKDFLILGNMNAATYKEFFPLIMENKIWPGPDFRSTVEFEVPNVEQFKKEPRVDSNGKSYISVQGITWWTNLDYPKRYELLELNSYYKGNEDKYPTYHNYNAINVNRVSKIPKDFNGIMGVPISYIGKHNPNQFEIIGLGTGSLGVSLGIGEMFSNEEHRLLRLENRAYRRGNLCYKDNNGVLKIPYARILIKRTSLQ